MSARPVGDAAPDGAFVGVSLDSKQFTRQWVASAIVSILNHHGSVTFLLADDLLSYTRTATKAGDTWTVDFGAMQDYVHSHSHQMRSFLGRAIERVGPSLAQRVSVRTWCDFADREFVECHRRLRIAYSTLPSVHHDIRLFAQQHVAKVARNAIMQGMLDACADYIIDEAAMCIRVSELGRVPFEYHPAGDSPFIRRLYSGEYSSLGLTVAEIVGKAPERVFTHLTF